MRNFLLLIILLAASPVYVAGQDERTTNAERVRSVIQERAVKSGKASVLTRKLVIYSGRIVAIDEDSFGLKIKKKVSTIKYEDVLELSAGDKHLSFVPEVTKSGHGLWEDVNKIYPNTKIVISLHDGKTLKGFANSATSTKLIIIDRERYERMEIEREHVVALYGLIGGYGGVKKGASKGAEAMRSGGDQLLGGAITGVAALVGLIKSDGRPILIYSK